MQTMNVPMVSWLHQFLLLLIIVLSSNVLSLTFADSALSSMQPSYSCLDHERSALLEFKQSFIIDCTTSADPFARPKLKLWRKQSGNCCMWEGIECNQDSGHVIGLDLSSSCLYGTLPINSSIFKLSHLESLNLGFNHFNYSEISPSIGQLGKLSILNLSNSVFSGQIPSEISKLSSLSILDLSLNYDPLTEHTLLELRHPSLEKLVGNLTTLSELHLADVDIPSTVPLSFVNLTSLKVISLTYCNLYGEFPSGVFDLPELESVFLAGNTDLGGSLPEFLPNSPLRELDLDLTQFSGKLPPSIGYLGSLKRLILWRCHFSGMIPSTIGNLTQLEHLNLGFNNFAGYIPFSVTNLTHLLSLDISSLKFRSTDLMDWWPKLSKLTVLSLRGIDLVGEISPSLVNLTQLRFLDLSENHLRGSIPSWFANLSQLSNLYLEFNGLQGPIPGEISQLINLKALSLAYNSGLFCNFNTFLKLKKLTTLDVSGANPQFPPYIGSINSSSVRYLSLTLNSCNLTKLPEFLRDQDELQYLSLSANNIQGHIPPWFVSVSKDSLLFLDVSYNLLTGFEQPLLDLPWNLLEHFHLNNNRLQGLLPNPSNSMLVYMVSDNLLTGAIPENICNAGSLIALDLSNNKMSGPIPHCFGDQLAQSLIVLNLRGNNFNGSIPITSSKSCQLKMINLGENQLEGNLPRSLANCKMLVVFDIGRNKINDTFPSWLGGLTNLQVLVLRHNNFHGVVPSPKGVFVFPSLRIIDLSCNFYSGELPSGYLQHWNLMKMSDRGQDQSASSGNEFTLNFQFAGTIYSMVVEYNYSMTITSKGSERLYPKILKVFRVIDFSSNKFTGRIPDSIGNLRGLQALNLSNNYLEGGIPSSLASMKGLESLDLSQNLLSGGIPQDLSQLTFLEVFNVSHNHLVGPVPQGGQFNTFDNSSFDGNLRLCGSPLSSKCKKTDDMEPLPPSSVGDNEKEDEPEWVDWMIRSLGCAGGFVAGAILGKLYITDKHHEWFVDTFGKRKSKRKGQSTKTQELISHLTFAESLLLGKKCVQFV